MSMVMLSYYHPRLCRIDAYDHRHLTCPSGQVITFAVFCCWTINSLTISFDGTKVQLLSMSCNTI